VPTDAVLLSRSAGRTTAWVICAACGELVARAVPHAAVQGLVAAGCHLLSTAVAVHPERATEGPALDADDALALHELLADDDLLADLLDGLRVLDEPSA
jgi:hypothetical protein